MAEVQLQNLSAHHHGMIEFIVANMHDAYWRKKVCEQFQVTPAWLSVIWHSDSFREEFYKRLTQHRDTASRELQARQLELAKAAYDKLLRIIKDDATEDKLVLEIANTTMKNLGFGPSPGAGPSYTKESEVTRTQTRVVAPGVLEEARVTYRKVTQGEQLPAVVGG